MTRDERIQAALDTCYPDASRPSHGQLSRALDAALADVGGLDGLDGLLIARGVWLAQVDDERDALRADRDRLREALRATVGPALGPHTLAVVEDALRESEAGSCRLTWRPPRLTRPARLAVEPGVHQYNLAAGKDYRIVMPSVPLEGPGGLILVGGRNVVLIGGRIDVPAQGDTATIEARRGLYLKDQTGTVHVEGLRITGAGLSEGINLCQRQGATVQIENVRVEAIRARDEVNFTDNHPDVLQTWAGPKRLRVDRLTGTTDYQGLMINPTDIGPYPAELIDLRRVNIRSLPSARKLFNKAGGDPMTTRDLWWETPPNPPTKVWEHTWPVGVWTAKEGVPPGGDFVPASQVGIGYRSPGYVT